MAKRLELVDDAVSGYGPPHDDTDLRDEIDAPARGSRPYQLLTSAALDSLPAQRWTIDQAIPQQAIVAVIGPKGAMKTFVVVDLVAHIMTGLDWHGRRVRQGPVIYIFAEGPFGARARFDAWCQLQSASGFMVNRADLPLWLLPTRIPINDAVALAQFIAEIRKAMDVAAVSADHEPPSPALVVIDTLNQNLDGDEDGKGMGGFTKGCVTLRDALRTTVLVVHHTPLGVEDRGRGHTAFDGAIDTRLIVTRDADRITLECTHQRNGSDGWSVAYEATPIAGSIALKPSGQTAGALTGQRRQILAIVHQQSTASAAALLRETGIGRSSFYKATNWLLDTAYMRKDKRNYVATESGIAALKSTSPPSVHHD